MIWFLLVVLGVGLVSYCARVGALVSGYIDVVCLFDELFSTGMLVVWWLDAIQLVNAMLIPGM